MFLLAPNLIFFLALLGAGLAGSSPLPAVLQSAFFWLGLYRTHRRGKSLTTGTENALALLAILGSFAVTLSNGQLDVFAFRHWLTLILVIRAYRRRISRSSMPTFRSSY